VSAPVPLRPRTMPQVIALSRRSVVGLLRELPLLLPGILFPLVFVAINAGSFSKSLPLLNQCCYPELDSFVTFTLASSVVQGVLFGSVQGATGLATDIEQGFFERMIASPVNRVAILVSRLAGAAFLGALQAVAFAVILTIFGARVAAGVPGYLVIVLSGALIALGFGALLAAMAIKTGSAEAVQSTFPLAFVLLFASSAFFPRETMSGWFRTLADWNPLSHITEGLRELVINGWSTSGALNAIDLPIGIAVVGIALALVALRRRLAAS
jgi:ABC-2 type transport system permease protein